MDKEENTYIACDEKLETTEGVYHLRTWNRQTDFILTLPTGKEVRDNLFELEIREEVYKLLGKDEEVLQWMVGMRQALEDMHISKGAAKMNFKYRTPRFEFTQNTTGMCRLTFHHKYKTNLEGLGLTFPIKLG